MTLRKEFANYTKELDKDLDNLDNMISVSFKDVGKDIDYLVNEIKRLNKRVRSLEKDRSRETKVGTKTGKTYMTNTGKINALADFLGVNLEVKPAEKVKASISVNKVKKGKK